MKKINKIIITSMLLLAMFVLSYSLVKPNIASASTLNNALLAAPALPSQPVGHKGETYDIKDVQYTVYPGQRVYLSGTSDGFGQFYSDDFLSVSTSLGTWQHSFNTNSPGHSGCGDYVKSEAPVDITNLFLSGYETQSVIKTAHLVFKDTCGSVEGHSDIWFVQRDVSVACSTSSQCGTNGYIDSPFCQNGDVYQNYKTYTCTNPGTVNSACANSINAQLKTNCTANQTCSNGSCINQVITCSNNSQCGTNAYIGSPFCQNGDVYQNYKTYTCTNPGTVNSACANSINAQLKTNCTANQICSNGFCKNIPIPITCSTNSQCGTNGYIDSPFCQNGDVYQNYKTYTCTNPGTVNSACSNSINAQLKTNCITGQTCSNGSCVANPTPTPVIACSTNANCGTNSLTGNPFCQGNNVFTNQLTYYCNNPGTSQSFCSNSFIPQLTKACGTNKACVNGDCVTQNIACGSNSDCGSNGLTGNAFCQDDKVNKNYITYSCNNPGTSQSFCSSSLTPQLTQTCSPTQNCVNGSCTGQNIACTTNSSCGTNAYTGSPFCQNGNVYQNYRTYTCINPGTSNSSCDDSTAPQLKNNCTSGQTCSNGSCGNTCSNHSSQQCSDNSVYWFDSCGTKQELSQYCQNGCQNGSCIQLQQNIAVQTNSATNVNNNQVTLNGYLSGVNNSNSCNTNYVWFQWGTSTSYGNETYHQNQNSTGSFSQNVTNISSNNTYHFRAVAQGCSSGLIYGQDMTFVAGSSYTGNLLTINKTVRNISSGNSGWSNTAYAVPSDMLMFMITVQATGNQDATNVFVRDNFPSTLIYKNQLVISGSNNYNNYSGDITSGINLNTISAGQTVTITYQAQVAQAQNFSYGTSTINNGVTVTSSGSGYNPTSNASVVVTRATVFGATSISTGLTNNFLADSFILPLMLALLGLWMFKLGMFNGIEGWVNSRRKKLSGYKVEKTLNSRIAQIRELERI